jgi:xylulokinase
MPSTIRIPGAHRERRQILADVLGAEIATVNTSEGAAYGAGLLAAVGAGWHPTVEAASEALVTATPVAAPGPDAPRYDVAHAVYRDLYPALGAVVPEDVSRAWSAWALAGGQPWSRRRAPSGSPRPACP